MVRRRRQVAIDVKHLGWRDLELIQAEWKRALHFEAGAIAAVATLKHETHAHPLTAKWMAPSATAATTILQVLDGTQQGRWAYVASAPPNVPVTVRPLPQALERTKLHLDTEAKDKGGGPPLRWPKELARVRD